MSGDEYTSLETPGRPPGRVSVSPSFPPIASSSSPASRRLSARFNRPPRPAPSAEAKSLAWISLQGRLVRAEEATSASSIGGGLDPEAIAAWELFTPLQRVLLVAVIAAAAAASGSKCARKIALQRSVDTRDDVLLSMQQKLETLCKQMSFVQDQIMGRSSSFAFQNERLVEHKKHEQEAERLWSLSSPALGLHPESGMVPLCRDISKSSSNRKDCNQREEVVKTDNVTMGEPEERRMSDLSDFNWSVTSSVDFQMSTLAAEQEFYNLRKECEEKDSKIKELDAAARESSFVYSKKIKELEDVIRRKNLVISYMKKDMSVLEQKVIDFTRVGRASWTTSNSSTVQLPFMANNILYDLSSTSSSSDPESPDSNRHNLHGSAAKEIHGNTPKRHDLAVTETEKQRMTDKSADRLPKKSFASSIKNQRIQRSEPALRPRQLLHSSGMKRITRKPHHQEPRSSAQQRM